MSKRDAFGLCRYLASTFPDQKMLKVCLSTTLHETANSNLMLLTDHGTGSCCMLAAICCCTL